MKVKVNRATGIIRKWVEPFSKGEYQSLIKVWSGPKGTRRHLLKGFKSRVRNTYRQHHFLSDGERRHGVLQESKPETIDFFEQFPLWDLERAIRIAHEMQIRYPMDENGEAYVLSTDLLCREYDRDQKKIVKVAYSYKPLDSIDFNTKHPVSINRTLDKLELERRYWHEQGVQFKLITDAHVSKTCAYNLKYCRASAYYKDEFIQHERRFTNEFVNAWYARPSLEITPLLEALQPKLGISQSNLVALFHWGIWTHQIPANLEIEINLLRPLEMVEIK